MKNATKRTIGVVDPDGIVVACSDLTLIGSKAYSGKLIFSESDAGTAVNGGRTYTAIGAESGDDYYVFTDGEDEVARTVCVIASIAISEAGAYYEENNDKRAFVKNIVSENILPGDIFVRAKELNFASDVTRGVLVIRHAAAMDISAVDLIRDAFPDRQRDFVISVNDTDVALIKEIPASGDLTYLQNLAVMIEQKLDAELLMKSTIGIGTPAKHLRELADRYKEALIAIDVGKVFDAEKTIISYESLGIGRLIYQLPTTLCEIFLSEVFKMNPIEALDHETLFTIDKFFENSLNVSETSRKLFVHRNTLVYRLEKIKKITGLDLREFDHAIIFKVALMVKKYLLSQESKY